MKSESQTLIDLAACVGCSVEELPKEINRILATLRRTADGVVIVPRMQVWIYGLSGIISAIVESVGYSIDLKENSWGTGTVQPEKYFYSTREALEKAILECLES